MREVLFRGKYKGKWIYGSLISLDADSGYVFMCEPYLSASTLSAKELISQNITPVDRETVGQYTGLKDKNGQRIFEGDVLKISKKSDSLGAYFFPPIDYPHNVIVRWDMCAWLWEVIGKDKYYIQFPDAWCHYECEVIGNIHDNPELLDSAGT